MAKSVASKKRTLSIMKALLEKSDEAHRLSTNDLLEMLEQGISTNRKSIYDDIETLKEWGDGHPLHQRKAGGILRGKPEV